MRGLATSSTGLTCPLVLALLKLGLLDPAPREALHGGTLTRGVNGHELEAVSAAEWKGPLPLGDGIRNQTQRLGKVRTATRATRLPPRHPHLDPGHAARGATPVDLRAGHHGLRGAGRMRFLRRALGTHDKPAAARAAITGIGRHSLSARVGKQFLGSLNPDTPHLPEDRGQRTHWPPPRQERGSTV